MKICVKMERSAPSDCEVRAMIKFLNVEGVPGSEICHRLSNVYDAGNVMTLCYIYKSTEHFNTRRSNLHDERRTSHPRGLIND